ncbi:protein adenylyltransferase SelO [Poseidonocella sedimentorum]|uniref:Protein nucleotidyltransferase YdiU n=1 Tax=Poseidonocella sedimentorum TaxID=871652 RepID=A0A1I6DE45_9RHOB|nr:YdiU family protein [Poseidonocella sedimentorum]SFR03750.1 Uncharacterized conserved protein YdiU, UPF0061 family [Poseidonocella sedimentorum]
MTLHIPFDNSFADLPDAFYARQSPQPVSAPALLAYNSALGEQLGIERSEGDASLMAELFAGNRTPDGADPLAQVYAGHQFGNFSPRLGDGRAVLLGEVVDRRGERVDIQLKGSGQTPFSRMGDGRAWLGPVLREYIVSEAMHALGIPTTRALAAVSTGDLVYREQGPLPGAVLTRVAKSHLRIGTFQYFAARQDVDNLRRLTDYAISRHAPEAQSPRDLLAAVIAEQAKLIAQWMGVGFIHGVMNTDNTSISGETIDYGPCAFMDDFHPARVYSSIDRQGRYAYQNQPDIIVWNIAQLASALLALEPDQDGAVRAYTETVHAMPGLIREAWADVFAAKLGITHRRDEDAGLASEWITLMANQGADFTNAFRALEGDRVDTSFGDEAPLQDWLARWRGRIAGEPDPAALMRRSNPAIIPRNHRIEAMIAAAVGGDMGPFETLRAALASPFEPPADPGLTAPPRPEEEVHATFCGT